MNHNHFLKEKELRSYVKHYFPQRW